jgi:predicted AAA+ superfamily ATPase
VIERIAFENPWWKSGRIDEHFRGMRRRAYFELLWPLVNARDVHRAVIVMGPRRVGKTVLLHHVIDELVVRGTKPSRVCYLSVDHPIYNGLSLDELVTLANEAAGRTAESPRDSVFVFDEIQYLRDWERHLKALVDDHPRARWIASGSSAAALRLKSVESGAGRFTEFLLPPLTFHEYLVLLGKDDLVEQRDDRSVCSDLGALNAEFVDYLNFGGYPEVALSSTIRTEQARYVRSDIIDKVLLRDLPTLYGIQDVQELNSLFMTLAFNTANEVSLEALSKRSGVAKNTIKRYIEYLEAAFLVKRVHRVDENARRFQRATYFKVYLTNPSLRAALFAPMHVDDEDMGDLVETAVFAQWFHSVRTHLHYARWKTGEVDIVELGADERPTWVVEAKWSDRFVDQRHELRELIGFCRHHHIDDALVTTRTMEGVHEAGGVVIEFRPASLYCFEVGRNLVLGRRRSTADSA